MNQKKIQLITDSELVDAASVRKLGEEIDRPSDVILGGALSNRYNDQIGRLKVANFFAIAKSDSG